MRDSLGTEAQHSAIKCLINLCGASVLKVKEVVSVEGFLPWLLDVITVSIFRYCRARSLRSAIGKTPQALLADPLCMLLSNLTQKLDQVSTTIINDKARLQRLFDVLVSGADKNRQVNKNANFDFLASVFANISTLPDGRQWLLEPQAAASESRLRTLSVFLEHESVIRRGGIASLFKCVSSLILLYLACLTLVPNRNVSFDSKAHPTILDAHNLLPFIMLPLCGPEEFELEDSEKFPEEIQLMPPDKLREPDPAVRTIHLETLILWAATRQGRQVLRDKNVYRVIQKMHLAETDEHCKELCVRLVGLLMKDEEASVEEVGSSRVMVKEDDDLAVQEV